MAESKRPNQVVFYANETVQGILRELDKGDRSEFINKAVEAFHERKSGGKLYWLEKAYETLKFMPTPEAESVRTALREILWRRGDTPDAVVVRMHLNDGSHIVDQFADMDKAILIALARPEFTKLEMYDKEMKLIGIGSRTSNDTFAWV